MKAEAPAPPPALLLTVAHTDSEASLGSFSTSELAESAADSADQQSNDAPAGGAPPPLAAAAAEQGTEQPPAEAPHLGSDAATSEAAQDRTEAPPRAGDGGEQPPGAAAAALQRQGSCESGDGEVLRACWLPLADPGDAGQVLGRVRVTVRASTPAGLEQQLWRRLLTLADLDCDGTLSGEEFEALLAVRCLAAAAAVLRACHPPARAPGSLAGREGPPRLTPRCACRSPMPAEPPAQPRPRLRPLQRTSPTQPTGPAAHALSWSASAAAHAVAHPDRRPCCTAGHGLGAGCPRGRGPLPAGRLQRRRRGGCR